MDKLLTCKNLKLYFQIIFFFIFTVSSSQPDPDSSKTKLKAYGTISLNSNGIAPIPAFALDKPAVVATIILVKKRLSYEPQLAYGLDFRPWYIDNWIRYKFIYRPKFEFRAGGNISTFFSEYELQDETIWQGQRYFALELAGTYKFTSKCHLSLTYWNDRGQDKGTLTGHFITLIGERSDMNIGKNVLFSASLQVFYINYNGNNDGLFISPKVSTSLKNIPFTIFFQGIQPVNSNILPSPGFKWNLGFSHTF